MTSDEEALPRPVVMGRSPGDFDPTSNTIKVMTMKVSKGLEFPVVALPEVQPMPVGSTQARPRNSIKAGGPK